MVSTAIRSRGHKLAITLLSLATWACGLTDVNDEQRLDKGQDAIQPCASRATTRVFATFDNFPAGVAGNERVVFVGSPLEGSIRALDRITKRQIGTLPPPAEGFVLPFILHSLGESRIAVLDAGGFPSPVPFVPANPRIYEYEYQGGGPRAFNARLVRTISFERQLIGFAEDIVPLAHGRYVLSDAILGGLWVVERDGSIRPGIVSPSAVPGEGPFPLAFCPTMPQITVGGLPFLFSGSTLPGVAALAERAGRLYFYSPCARGLYSIPVASLFDARPPSQRIADIVPVSLAPASVRVEELLGLAFNPFGDDPYLYAADSLQLRIIRIDVKSGERQIVADDPTLFNFPSSTNFLPPLRGIAPLLVVSNQQHRSVLTNDAISEDMLQLPFLATEVIVR